MCHTCWRRKGVGWWLLAVALPRQPCKNPSVAGYSYGAFVRSQVLRSERQKLSDSPKWFAVCFGKGGLGEEWEVAVFSFLLSPFCFCLVNPRDISCFFVVSLPRWSACQPAGASRLRMNRKCCSLQGWAEFCRVTGWGWLRVGRWRLPRVQVAAQRTVVAAS